jgi:hypothetical protein
LQAVVDLFEKRFLYAVIDNVMSMADIGVHLVDEVIVRNETILACAHHANDVVNLTVLKT